MGLTQAQWDAWRASIDAWVAAHGEWVGLLNGSGEPVCQLPPIIEMEAKQTRLAAADISITVTLQGHSGVTHPVVERMVSQGLGRQDSSGRLMPDSNKTWMIAVVRDGVRRVYLVTFPVVSLVRGVPVKMRFEGTDLNVLLEETPCPSVPAIWGHEPFREWTQDAGGAYTKPRSYAPIELATVARGYTKRDTAERAIQDVIQDSLDAVMRLKPSFSARPHLAVDYTSTGRTSPTVTIRREDKTIWETIADTARLAGVSVWVDLWWPGDPPIPLRGGGTWSGLNPIGVIRAQQMEVTA